MVKYLAAYGASLACLLGLDAIWLTQMTGRLYQPLIGPLLAETVVIAAAVVFYLLYIFGVVALAVVGSARWQQAAMRGGLLGLVAYGTYDLTNQATLKGWPLVITLADMTWGTALTAASATAGYAAFCAVGRSR